MKEQRVLLYDTDEQFWATLLVEFLEEMKKAGFTYLTLKDFARTEYIQDRYVYDKMFEFYWRKGFNQHATAPLCRTPRTSSLGRYAGPWLGER